jgi:hypothetical protein
MSEHRVAMQILEPGQPADEARERLAGALAGATVGEPDANGIFEIAVTAPDQEQALQRVWDAIAAAGADDHVAFAEHADVPEHWRTR